MERVYLRALEPEDYKTSIYWRKDDEIWDMLGGPKHFVSEYYEKQWVLNTISSSKDIKLAICLKDSNLYIGNVYLTDINYINRSANSHVLIGNKEYWGGGYAKEALSLMLDFAFNERGLNRVSAHVLESNIASIRMLQKIGYQIEGVLRESVFKNGKFRNQVVLSILNLRQK